jgi:hypothetical protein
MGDDLILEVIYETRTKAMSQNLMKGLWEKEDSIVATAGGGSVSPLFS